MRFTKKYHKLLEKVVNSLDVRIDPNRKGVLRRQIPFYTLVHDMNDGFPIVTTKPMWWKGIVAETLWLLRGENDITSLQEQGVHIWDEDAKNFNPNLSDNSIGKLYGYQWRNYGSSFFNSNNEVTVGIDQIQRAIEIIKMNPLSSNITVFGDNPEDRELQRLPACMNYMQFSCSHDGGESYYLDLSINYRSHDLFLGYPWNAAQYGLILCIMAELTNTKPRYLRIVSQNVHLYDNQILAAKQMLSRELHYKTSCIDIPDYKPWQTLDDYVARGREKYFELHDYVPRGKLDYNPPMLGYDKL